jgi:hypothetical protein
MAALSGMCIIFSQLPKNDEIHMYLQTVNDKKTGI